MRRTPTKSTNLTKAQKTITKIICVHIHDVYTQSLICAAEIYLSERAFYYQLSFEQHIYTYCFISDKCVCVFVCAHFFRLLLLLLYAIGWASTLYIWLRCYRWMCMNWQSEFRKIRNVKCRFFLSLSLVPTMCWSNNTDEKKKGRRKWQNEIDACDDDNIDDTLTKYDTKQMCHKAKAFGIQAHMHRWNGVKTNDTAQGYSK